MSDVTSEDISEPVQAPGPEEMEAIALKGRLTRFYLVLFPYFIIINSIVIFSGAGIFSLVQFWMSFLWVSLLVTPGISKKVSLPAYRVSFIGSIYKIYRVAKFAIPVRFHDRLWFPILTRAVGPLLFCVPMALLVQEQPYFVFIGLFLAEAYFFFLVKKLKYEIEY